MKRLLLLTLCWAVAATSSDAVSVRRWSASTAREFQLGTFDGTSIDRAGRVVLAPKSTLLWGPESGILWDLDVGKKGRLFAAISSPGQLLVIESDGSTRVWYDALGDSMVTALVADGSGGVYAGISPQGQVLHLKRAGDLTVVVETGAAFVWALDRDDRGALWIGTGVPGTVQRYDPRAGHETVYESGDDPIRALSASGSAVIAGTGGRGRVIRINQEGRPFVLLDAPESEIVALEQERDGTIWALAAVGGKRAPTPGRSAPPTAGNYVRVTAEPAPEDEKKKKAPPAKGKTKPEVTPKFRTKMGGRLYRIDADGNEVVWSTEREIPFDLSVSEQGTLLVSTGERGRVWQLDRQGEAANPFRIGSNHASALTRDAEGNVWIGGTSDARVERLDAQPRKEGAYLSLPIDAGAQARWGRVEYDAPEVAGTTLNVEVRAGNTTAPDDTWSDWVPLLADGNVDPDRVPPSRLLQLRVSLRSDGSGTPVLSGLQVSFLPRNRSPQIESLLVELPGVVMVPGNGQASARLGPWVAADPVTRQAVRGARRGAAQRPVRRAFEAGMRTFSWAAKDPDGDRLLYRLELRRENESFWYPLASDLTVPYFSWDARSTPDGDYRVRLTVSDEMDNAEGRERSRSEIGTRFTIDNSRPTIGEWSVGKQQLEFTAVDPGGTIAAVEIAVDGGEWIPLRPIDGVADSEREQYRVPLPQTNKRSNSVRIRATDAAGNLGGALRRLE